MKLARVLGTVLLAVSCSGGGSGPTGTSQFTLADLIGVWNITMSLRENTCGLNIPATFLDVWEFYSQAGAPQYLEGDESGVVIFSESGAIAYSRNADGLAVTFQGRLASPRAITGTWQAIGGGCAITYGVSGQKL